MLPWAHAPDVSTEVLGSQRSRRGARVGPLVQAHTTSANKMMAAVGVPPGKVTPPSRLPAMSDTRRAASQRSAKSFFIPPPRKAGIT
mmetsp:Transcript_19059/g.26469  ORF Transcript_19059/g.26469 Transcript_19059/m.26469 type:complete len:87 (+) Transcript_19059:387-647(+)|eukprot:scaffold203085_cov30-Tisochrysis_lutea.AAC.2